MIYNPEMAEYAESLGYKVIDHGHQSAESYEKGNVHIWPSKYGYTWAQLIDGRYQNHTLRMDLKEALEKEDYHVR